MSSSIFCLKNISFAYPGGKEVLSGINFELKKGDRVALTGHNGSGKTTMLHVIMGLLTPSSGEILYKGHPVKGEKGFRELRKGVGLLFQQADDQLFCPTVIEDVAFGPLNIGKSVEEARRISEYTLCTLGLSGYEDRVSYHLSGGEKKLVSLATVLAMQPEALVLDEPTNDLDPSMRERLIEILNSLDVSLLVVSHDLNFLQRVTQSEYSCLDGELHQGEAKFDKGCDLSACKV